MERSEMSRPKILPIVVSVILAIATCVSSSAPLVTRAAPPTQPKAQLAQSVANVVPNLPLYAQSDVAQSNAPLTSPLSMHYAVEDATSALPVAFDPSSAA